ncbi:MAG: hypothetical protein ACREFR_11935 [Limisphaerales bacterium]
MRSLRRLPLWTGTMKNGMTIMLDNCGMGKLWAKGPIQTSLGHRSGGLYVLRNTRQRRLLARIFPVEDN